MSRVLDALERAEALLRDYDDTYGGGLDRSDIDAADVLHELRDALAELGVRHDEMIGWYLGDNGEALARLLSAKEG